MGKHLTIEEREIIQERLSQSASLGEIAKELSKHVSVISREIKKRAEEVDKGAIHRIKNRCVLRKNCSRFGLCIDKPNCVRKCSSCSQCNRICEHFEEEHCVKLSTPPYVCNGCSDMNRCVLRKKLYRAVSSQKHYQYHLVNSRVGFNLHESEYLQIDELASPLIQQGQSIRHISITQQNQLQVSARTLYRLVAAQALTARNIDMPRVCRMRPRRNKPILPKVDKQCLEGRRYEDFLVFISEHVNLAIVEMDSVIGRVGGKVLLTLHLKSFDFMLAFIRPRNTAQSVIDILSDLRKLLKPKLFFTLFPVLLTDNGTEFSNPSAIEFSYRKQNTHVFYCHPSSPYEKPNVEVNHEFIRRIIPKGKSMDSFTQEDIDLMMSHINSYARDKFNGKSPAQLLSNAFGKKVLHLLGQTLIAPENIILNSSIFKK